MASRNIREDHTDAMPYEGTCETFRDLERLACSFNKSVFTDSISLLNSHYTLIQIMNPMSGNAFYITIKC